jgi:CheY-like chemotaxis protein
MGFLMGRSTAISVVADDDDDARALVANLLRRLGSNVFEVSDGAQLLARVRALADADAQVNLVISDIGMPECDGIAATQQLLRSDPRLTVVLMTAFADQATVKRAIASGARHVLRKPFSLTALEELVVGLQV